MFLSADLSYFGLWSEGRGGPRLGNRLFLGMGPRHRCRTRFFRVGAAAGDDGEL